MRITERWAHAWIQAIIAHPRVVLAVFALCTGVLGWQARHFQIDASADTLLLKNDPDYIRTEIVERRFAPQEFLLIVYRPRNGDLFGRQTFRDLRSLSKQLRGLRRVASVRSILDVPLFSGIRDGVSSLDDLKRLSLENKSYSEAQLKKEFRGNPLYEDLLINRQQTATALQVLFRPDDKLKKLNDRIVTLKQKSLAGGLSDGDAEALTRLEARARPVERRLDAVRADEIRTIRRILTGYEDRAELYMGGVHVLAFQLVKIIRNDLVVFGAAITGMICLLLWLLFRKLRWVVIPMACCACSALATMGLFGMLGFKTTVISANFVVLQLILTLAVVIHLIVQYRELNAAHGQWDQAQLVRTTLIRKAGPCFYAGITTSVGFASLLFSRIQPVITFGWMMIIAMFFSIGVSLVLFPAAMVMLPKESTPRPWRYTRRFLKLMADLNLKHGIAIGVVSAATLAGSVGGLMRLDVENSFIDYFRKTTRVHRELTFIDRQFGGSTPLDMVYTIPAGQRKKDLVLTADTVSLLQHVQHALEGHRAVGKILSVVNFTELARQVNQDRPLTEYELTAVYWTMADALREELLGAFFDPQHAQVRFSMRIKDSTAGLRRADLLTQIRADLRKLGLSKQQYGLSGLFVLYQDILQQLFRSQILTMGIVYAVLTLTFLVIFRSLKVALIGIAPNILSTLAVLGVMGWLKIPLDLMTITIAAVAMGIAVDDTIHYTHRYLEELEASSADEAVRRSHASVGHAIVYTSLVITLGFALLTFSDFVPSALFGLLTGLAMLAALAFDLCLLPVLLNRFVQTR